MGWISEKDAMMIIRRIICGLIGNDRRRTLSNWLWWRISDCLVEGSSRASLLHSLADWRVSRRWRHKDTNDATHIANASIKNIANDAKVWNPKMANDATPSKIKNVMKAGWYIPNSKIFSPCTISAIRALIRLIWCYIFFLPFGVEKVHDPIHNHNRCQVHIDHNISMAERSQEKCDKLDCEVKTI